MAPSALQPVQRGQLGARAVMRTPRHWRSIIDGKGIALGADAVARHGGDALDEAIPTSFEIAGVRRRPAPRPPRVRSRRPRFRPARPSGHRIPRARTAYGYRAGGRSRLAAQTQSPRRPPPPPVSNRMSKRFLCTRRGCLCARGAPRGCTRLARRPQLSIRSAGK